MSEAFSHLVPVSAIPAAGRHFRLEAGAGERRQLAEAMEIADIESLVAELDVRPAGVRDFAVTGAVKAVVIQTDVVTLDPVRQELEEAVHLTLRPAEAAAREPGPADIEGEGETEDPDLYHNGRLDLGRIVSEHLALGLDPYPRSPGTVFEGYTEDRPAAIESPFAKLATLKKDGG